MMTITAEAVARAVERAIPQLACGLPADVEAALECARGRECDLRGAGALDALCLNARLAREEGLPVCQDTGTVRVLLEIGPDVCVAGDVFSQVDAAVARAYAGAGLRASVVRDALSDRANTGDNTPSFCRVVPVDEPGCARLRVMLKGGGSDNACRVVMLPPSAGRAGVVREVLALVREKAANACPPLVVGVGVGGTFDAVAELASRALWREVGTPAVSPEAAALEAELLEAVNGLGIGAGAQGGSATALAVHVETAPCHIAALPVAIELGCCAMRRCTIELGNGREGASSLARTVLSSHGQPTGLSGSCGTRREDTPSQRYQDDESAACEGASSLARTVLSSHGQPTGLSGSCG
ncbi:MAG: fumarate hydratase, partial [Eggerthellaceae bacterium]|nr:fumarate hydratase [Eggerthellaceae bacterium]